jgi:hypothetical protein
MTRCARSAHIRNVLLVLTVVAVAGCSGGGGGGGAPPPPVLTLSPNSATIGAGTAQSLAAAGGVPPYSYTVLSGAGSVDAVTGAFTASSSSGTTVVQVTDSRGSTARSTLTIVAVGFAHATESVDSGSTTVHAASGGAPPYTYQVIAGGGTVDGAGKFTAPAGPASVTLSVTDSKGATAQELLTVNPPLAVASSQPVMGAGTTVTITVTGGQGPYVFSVTSGAGTVDASGHFTSPSAGTSVITATDAFGLSTNTTVIVNPPLVVSPASATLTASSNQTLPFVAQGGVPPYAFSVPSGSGAIDAQGVYTAGAHSGTDTVQITDAQGTMVPAPVRLLRIRVNGTVYATASDGTSLYVGGRFNAVNPYSAPRLAIVDQSSGNPVTTCDLGTGFLDGIVNSVVASGQSLYVAGNFNRYRGVVVGKLVKIDAATCALDTNFARAGGFGQSLGEAIYGLATVGNSLFVVGNFSSYRGAPFLGIVKLDLTTGDLDPTFHSPTSLSTAAAISAVAASGSAVYVGGAFTAVNGIASACVAKLDAATGAVDATFSQAPGADSQVVALAVSGSSLYVGGYFANYAGIPAGLVRVDATTGVLDLAFTQSVANYKTTIAILPVGSSVYIGRQFPVGGAPTLAKIDAATGTTDPTFTSGSGFDYGVYSIAMLPSGLFVGGAFTTYRNVAANHIAKLDPVTGALDSSFTQATGGNATVQALAASGTNIIAGGQLSTYRGSPVDNLTKFDIATDAVDSVFSAAVAPDQDVIALLLNGNSLYVAGSFSNFSHVNRVGLVKVNAALGALDAQFTAGGGAPFAVTSLLLHGTSLYIGGWNSSFAPPHVAKLDPLSGVIDPAFTASGVPNGQVNALADSANAIYVAGQFSAYGAIAAQNIAKVDPASGAVDQAFTLWNGAVNANDQIMALQTAGNAVYMGGSFTTFRGTAIQGLAKIDSATAVVDGAFTGTGNSGAVAALAQASTSLIVAGTFDSLNGSQSYNVAKANLTSGALDSNFVRSAACDSCTLYFNAVEPVGPRIFVGSTDATLYRGVPVYFVFPIDGSTGAPLDP